jgi:drug/metabolite transporter (DMT)-like permease
MRRIDALLVLMVVIWGVNYSVIKHAFAEIPPQPFNAIRITLASSMFLLAIRFARRRAGQPAAAISTAFFTPAPLTSRDFWDLIWLGLIGHCAYQF